MGDFWYVWVLPVVGGLLWFIITKMVVKAPGTLLATKFAKLGTLKGRSYNEIVAACGAPASVSPMGDGQKLCQWMATSYHIALLFDENNICLGVTHEASV